MFDRYIKNLSQSKYFLKRKYHKFALTLIVGAIAAIFLTTCFVPKITPAANTYTTSWIANSFGGGKKWVQIQISGMYVTPDGTVYTNSPWDEAGREVGIYQNGDVIGLADDLHGWERLGGVAVTADKNYIYVAMSQRQSGSPGEDYPPKGTTWYCVRRYNKTTGKTAPFPGGRGWDKSMAIVSTKSQVTGLANAGSELYVSDSGGNKVRVYDTKTMKELRSFSVPNPGPQAVDGKGTLWILPKAESASSGKVFHYSKQGKQLPNTIADVAKPSAIAVDNQGRLLIADNGPRQQVLIYSITGTKPVQVGTLGAKGGIYGGVPGAVGDLKFGGITGVGADAKGNIYVATDGFNRSGAELKQFSPSGKLLWRLMGLSFIDNADGDPATDAVDVYTKDEHFVMDYSKPPGKQWTYKGFTINSFKYPQDPRLNTAPDAPFFRRIKGKPYLFLTDMYGVFLQIYRFQKDTDGEIAIPSGMFIGTYEGKQAIQGKWPPNQPKSGEWIWRDKNGNGAFDSGEYDNSQDHPYIGGWWVDSKGDVWKTLRTQDGVGIRHYPLQGIDNKGNPVYTYKSMSKQKTPSFFTDLRRIEYFPETDTMYLTGFTKEHPAINGDYAKLVGSEIVRFDNWSKGNTKPRWRIVFPVDKSTPPEVLTPSAVDVARDYVFAVTVKKAEVYVYNAKTGALVKTLKPGSEVGGESGWVDIPYGVRAFRRSNGEYLVFVEEDHKGKVIMYRVSG
ncbi:hypothetical protein WA1_01600 [Scytonema hofmannii PCC 7110]|uniref:NHL repeat-containing protein n=1 Tax=Scytonema hofmannii PCC 7110 TaxID=128403 RepID=A0A139XGX3_9CYAN|nr:hypothetical protein [Scytonema hofmannii]KYC43872.1 hypothetical protein WA1_01600 [Scytonema hofmannii PCC 7110]